MEGILMKIQLFLLGLLSLVTQTISTGTAGPLADCFEGFQVTGYYGVLLSDYDLAKTANITVAGRTYTYNASFLAVAKLKTAGVTHDGNNLVYWQDAWRVQHDALSDEYPREDDYTATTTVTTLEGGVTKPLPVAFIDEVRIEGSGKIAEGEYLGWPFDGNWHLRTKALDASEREVDVGVVAVDPAYFDHDNPRRVSVTPQLPGLERVQFMARDKGEKIADKHIDVFTGWGLNGLSTSLGLTSETHRVCIEHRDPPAK